MAEQFSALQDKHVEFIREQHIFFVGTAGAEGRVNVSPKGMDSFRVMDANRVAWLNMTGRGNESAAHVMENGRLTIMFCSFDRQPLIMRLYGSSRAVHPRDDQWQELIELFPPDPGARQEDCPAPILSLRFMLQTNTNLSIDRELRLQITRLPGAGSAIQELGASILESVE